MRWVWCVWAVVAAAGFSCLLLNDPAAWWLGAAGGSLALLVKGTVESLPPEEPCEL